VSSAVVHAAAAADNAGSIRVLEEVDEVFLVLR
jgi:hypothetical protein